MKSLILRTTSPFLLVLLAVYSIFVLLRGHHDPGGGFVGGLLLAGGIALYSLSQGPAAARRLLGGAPRSFVGAGLLVATASACMGFLTGASFLAPIWLGEVPGIGYLGSVPLFDVGVYLVVAGTATEVLLTLAED